MKTKTKTLDLPKKPTISKYGQSLVLVTTSLILLLDNLLLFFLLL